MDFHTKSLYMYKSRNTNCKLGMSVVSEAKGAIVIVSYVNGLRYKN